MNNSNNKSFNLANRLKSIGYALEGILTFLKTQHNAFIQGIAAIIVIILGFLLDVNETEWCILIIAIALVFITEMLNTALEFLTDIASPEIHPTAKKVKDVAAGAVLVSAVAAIVIGIIIFLPKIFL